MCREPAWEVWTLGLDKKSQLHMNVFGLKTSLVASNVWWLRPISQAATAVLTTITNSGRSGKAAKCIYSLVGVATLLIQQTSDPIISWVFRVGCFWRPWWQGCSIESLLGHLLGVWNCCVDPCWWYSSVIQLEHIYMSCRQLLHIGNNVSRWRRR